MIKYRILYVKMAACNSGIFNLSCILCGLKILFSSECKTCLSVVHGTSTKICKKIIITKIFLKKSIFCAYLFLYYLIIHIFVVNKSRISLCHI